VVKDSAGQMLVAQLTEHTGQPRVAFQVTLQPGTRRPFDLRSGKQDGATDLWVEDSETALRLGNAHIGIELRKMLQDVVVLQMPLGGGARRWLLGTPALAESLAPLDSKNGKPAPLLQRYLIKHGDFPLDEVEDYFLEWPGDRIKHPPILRCRTISERRAKVGI